MEQDAEKSDENSDPISQLDVSSKNTIDVDLKSDNLRLNNSDLNEIEKSQESGRYSPSGSENSNCDAKLLNDSNNSDTNLSLIRGFEGATVCDSDSGSQGREGQQNDSAVSTDISMNNSFSTAPQAIRSDSSPRGNRSDSSVDVKVSSPIGTTANDSGVYLDKSNIETNSNGDMAKSISEYSETDNGISHHTQSVGVDKALEHAGASGDNHTNNIGDGQHVVSDNRTKSITDSQDHQSGVPFDNNKESSENFEELMEAMVTEKLQECTKPSENNVSSVQSKTEETRETSESTSSDAKHEVLVTAAVEAETEHGNDPTAASSPANQENIDFIDDQMDSDNDVEADVDRVIRLRRRLLALESDSSSDSSGDDAGPGIPVNESDENDDDYEDIRPLPKDPWRHIHSLRRREFGFNSRIDVSQVFRTQCGSSLRLVQRLECNKKLEYHSGCVNALHFNKTGTLLASGSDDLNIAVWNWMQDAPYFTFESGHKSNVFQCKFMPYTGDTHIATCSRDGQVRLAELSSTGVCKGTKKLAQHKGAAHKLALLEDSSHELYSCGEDALVYQIDLRQSKPQKLCTAKEKERKVALYSIHANPFKSYEFCTGGRDQFLRVYDKRMVNNEDGECTLKKFCPHHLVDGDVKPNVTCAVYNWNGTEVLGTYNDEDIYMFDNEMSDGAEFIHKYTGHRNNATVKGVNYYGPRSEYIVSGSDCGHVFLWERNTERIVNCVHADTGGVVNVLEPHPTMPMLATSGLDNDVKLFVPTAQEPTDLKGLAKRMKTNRKERENERSSEPEMVDGRMLWFLMHHLRGVRRNRPGGGDGEDDDSDDDTNSDNDSDNNSQNSDDGNPVECMQS